VKARARFSPVDPRRAKPKGASSGRRVNPLLGRQGLSEGLKPGNRALLGRPNAFGRRDNRQVKRYAGSSVGESLGYLSRGESSEGRIP
jgi:hypothetical protein